MPYTDIAITAPNSAEEGEPVSVSAQVTNTTALDLSFRVKLYADTTILVMVHRFVVHWDYDNHASKVVSLKTKAALSTVVKVLGIGALAVLGIALVARGKKRRE